MRWNRASVTAFMVISTIIFCIMTMLMRNADMLIVMRAFQITSSFAVAIRFWPAASEAWREDFKSSYQIYAFSMMVLSVALGLNAIWLWLWRSADEPRWVVDSWINGFFVLVTYLAHSGKIIAPGLKDGKPQHEAYTFIICTLVIGVILAVVGLLDSKLAAAVLRFMEPIARESALWDPAADISKWVN